MHASARKTIYAYMKLPDLSKCLSVHFHPALNITLCRRALADEGAEFWNGHFSSLNWFDGLWFDEAPARLHANWLYMMGVDAHPHGDGLSNVGADRGEA